MDDIKLSEVLKTDRPIVLIGMMGCGKTTIGMALAQSLGCAFYDTDSEIKKDQGISIAQIFTDHGERYFRNLETQKIEESLKRDLCVISTGGGLVTTLKNLDMIKGNAVSIWLRSDVAMILERLEGDDTRPLLKGGDAENKLLGLLKAREPLYSKADIHVKNDGDIETVIQNILQQLGEYNENT